MTSSRPNGPRVGDVTISYGDMMITGFCVGASLALFAFFGRTRMGRAMTAVVDDPNLLALQKSNPAVVRRLSWVLGSCFATISGMLLAPKLGVSVGVLVLIVIAAYGAAAVGLFENLPLTVAGAFFIGILVNYLPSQTQKTAVAVPAVDAAQRAVHRAAAGVPLRPGADAHRARCAQRPAVQAAEGVPAAGHGGRSGARCCWC